MNGAVAAWGGLTGLLGSLKAWTTAPAAALSQGEPSRLLGRHLGRPCYRGTTGDSSSDLTATQDPPLTRCGGRTAILMVLTQCSPQVICEFLTKKKKRGKTKSLM